MDTNQRYTLKYVAHLPELNKLWGWLVIEQLDNRSQRWGRFRFHTHAYAWWAEVGKTISVNRMPYNSGYLGHLERKKTQNGYKLLTEENLDEMWPEFREALAQRMLFEVLVHEN